METVREHFASSNWAPHSGIKDHLITFRDPDNIQLEFLWQKPSAEAYLPRRPCHLRAIPSGTPPVRHGQFFQRFLSGMDQDRWSSLDRCNHPGSHLGRGVAVAGSHGCSPELFLVRPQLNDAWDLWILLEIDFPETLGGPTWTPGHECWVSGLRVLCSRTAFCAFSRWAWVPAVVSPG